MYRPCKWKYYASVDRDWGLGTMDGEPYRRERSRLMGGIKVYRIITPSPKEMRDPLLVNTLITPLPASPSNWSGFPHSDPNVAESNCQGRRVCLSFPQHSPPTQPPKKRPRFLDEPIPKEIEHSSKVPEDDHITLALHPPYISTTPANKLHPPQSAWATIPLASPIFVGMCFGKGE